MENNDLISVIVPVYNVKDYLERCLNSIINQTYKNIEIILIDDGSTDGSSVICDNYKEIDNRIKVFHKKNGGLSSARNEGIKRSIGEYITFVDSDDSIDESYVDYLYRLIKKYDVRMSITPYNVVHNKNKKNIGNGYKECLMDTCESLDRLLCSEGFDVSSCAKLYSKKLFEDIQFPVGKLYEDNGTTYKLVMKCEKIAYDSCANYNYYIHDDSITTTDFNEKKLDLIEMVNAMCDDILAKYPILEESVQKKRIEAYLSIYRQIVFVKSNKYSKEKEKIKEYLQSNKSNIFKNSKLSFRDKVALRSLQIGDWFFKFSWNCYCFFTKK